MEPENDGFPKGNLLFQRPSFRFHVELQGCIMEEHLNIPSPSLPSPTLTLAVPNDFGDSGASHRFPIVSHRKEVKRSNLSTPPVQKNQKQFAQKPYTILIYHP